MWFHSSSVQGMGGFPSVDDDPALLVLIIATGNRVGVGATDVAVDVETPTREEWGRCDSCCVDYSGREMLLFMSDLDVK